MCIVQETIKRTVDEWRKKGIFPADTISSLRLEEVDLNAPVNDSPIKSSHVRTHTCTCIPIPAILLMPGMQSSHWQDLADEQEHEETRKSEDNKKKQKRDEVNAL